MLLVESHEDTRDLLEGLLRHVGARVECAGSWRAAVGLLRVEAPDVVVLDLGLRDVDGVEAVQQLKAHPSTSAIPVLAFSTTSTQEARALEAGVDTFMVRPASPELLVSAVRDLLVAPDRPTASSSEGS